MRSFPLVIPAGGQQEFNCAGARILLCDSASLPDFELQIDGGINIPYKVGRKYTHAGGESFRLVTVHNLDALNSLTVNLLVGTGDIQDNAVYVDTIQSIAQTVNTDDAGTQAAIAAAAAAIEARLSHRSMLPARLTTLQGAAYASGTASGASQKTEIVSAAANVNGVAVRKAVITQGTSAGGNPMGLLAGAGYVDYGSAGGSSQIRVENVFIPSGVKVEVETSGNNATWQIWYEVL